MDVSNKTYSILQHPQIMDEIVIADFVSNGQTFNEIHIYTAADDIPAEIWYVSRTGTSVAAYSGTGIVAKYREITFANNTTLQEEDYQAFEGSFVLLRTVRTLKINGKKAKILGKSQGTINFEGEIFEWSNL